MDCLNFHLNYIQYLLQLSSNFDLASADWEMNRLEYPEVREQLLVVQSSKTKMQNCLL